MKMNDENFINQLKKKNEKALDYVIQKYGWLIKTIVSKHLFSLKDHQEECINDVLLAIWKNIDQYDSKISTFQNWVSGIARYKSIDYKRKYLSSLQNEAWETTEIIYYDQGLADILENEISDDLKELLACLKEEDRNIFMKLFFEEKEVEMVCRETGLKPSVIYNRISRGKRKMKRLYEERKGV